MAHLLIAMLFLDKVWILNLDTARGFDKVGVQLDESSFCGWTGSQFLDLACSN